MSGYPRTANEAPGSVVREAGASATASMVIRFHVEETNLRQERSPSGPLGAQPRRVAGHQAEGATRGIGLSSTTSHPGQDLAPPPTPGSSHPEAASTTRSACRREGGEEKPVAHTQQPKATWKRENAKRADGGPKPPFRDHEPKWLRTHTHTYTHRFPFG